LDAENAAQPFSRVVRTTAKTPLHDPQRKEMRLPLSPAQSAQIEPHLSHGTVLLGRVDRAPFDGTNPQTSGALTLVFTSIPIDRLASVRAAISGEQTKPKTKLRNSTKTV
jgi:hypothetical protein